MREFIKRVWNKVKWGLFLIIWSAGLLGWAYFYQEFKVIKCEANQAYNESIKLKIERTKINAVDDGVAVSGTVVAPEASAQVSLGGTAEPKNSARPSDIEELIKQTWNNEEAKIAIAVAKSESHLDPKSIGDQHLKFYKDGKEYGASYGVFQIRHLQGRPDPSQLLDPEFNVKYAYELFCKSGFSPWSQFKNGNYLTFL